MESENKAWAWLLDLPRLDIAKAGYIKADKQIRIYICPGKLYETSGAPLVKISYQHPDLTKRFAGSGNSLFVAAENLRNELWRNGIKIPAGTKKNVE